jgi:Polysulphide reductase, NrfD
VRERVPTAASEAQLDQLRRQAEVDGRVNAPGIRPLGAPFPQATPQNGYYGLPLLKPPVWTWEIAAYFFVGGAGGAAAVLGAIARASRADAQLVRDARWLAAGAATLSAPLLIADLGRPERFLNMLRVLKPQSPMSVGAWILSGFGATTTAAAIVPGALGDVAAFASIPFGLGMATYTGVLLGATVIPVWSQHHRTLPLHFAASGVNAATSLLELRGHQTRALNAIGIGAAAVETAMGIEVERKRGDLASAPLRVGPSGALTRIGGVLSGPLPLALRLAGGKRMRRAAAVSSVIGSLVTRFAWIAAGRASARDPRVPLELDRRD